VATADDHRLAASAASDAGQTLNTLQQDLLHGRITGVSWWDDHGDAIGHNMLVERFGADRPHDGLLSEEGADDRQRLADDRVWIVDPLDGSVDFGRGAGDWAVHVALTEGGVATAGAVSLPVTGSVFSTQLPATVPDRNGRRPVVVAGRSRVGWDGVRVAEAIDASLMTCGSAGVKAMLVVMGEADVYIHGGPLYEWDVCAPAVVAAAAGLHVSDAKGHRLVYNKSRPVAPGFIVCRPEFAAATIDAL